MLSVSIKAKFMYFLISFHAQCPILKWNACRWDAEVQLTADMPARFGAWLLGTVKGAGGSLSGKPSLLLIQQIF